MKTSKLNDMSIEIIPEEDDDIWNLYNLISISDNVSATTFRKIIRETASGAKNVDRIKMVVEVKVHKIDYDRDGSTLRLNGKMMNGQFHTLEIKHNRSLTLTKSSWDSISRDILHRSCSPAARADLAVLLMHEGLAHLFLIGGSITTTVSKVKCSIPMKHGAAVAAYDSGLKRFFERVTDCVLRHIDFKNVRCLVIASPGCINEQFYKHLLLEAEQRQLKPITDNQARLVLSHADTGFKHGLKDVLNDRSIGALIKDTQAAAEARALEDFYVTMRRDESRICYGPKEVEIASEQSAIERLLITDELFRNLDVGMRRKYIDLVESVRGSGGSVSVFSCMHETGKELAGLSGIAATLRFPVPELGEID